MGQAKLRGSYEDRVRQGIMKRENEAWMLNAILDKEFESVNKHRKNKFMNPLTRSQLVEFIKLKGN